MKFHSGDSMYAETFQWSRPLNINVHFINVMTIRRTSPTRTGRNDQQCLALFCSFLFYFHCAGPNSHDQSMLRKWPRELGVYMVGFDRAGYGESDPNPARSVRSVALDMDVRTVQFDIILDKLSVIIINMRVNTRSSESMPRVNPHLKTQTTDTSFAQNNIKSGSPGTCLPHAQD